MNKKAIYESIMRNVAKELKKVLNENEISIDELEAQLSTLNDELFDLECEMDDYIEECENNNEYAQYTDKYSELENAIKNKKEEIEDLNKEIVTLKRAKEQEEDLDLNLDDTKDHDSYSNNETEENDNISEEIKKIKEITDKHKLIVIPFKEDGHYAILTDFYNMDLQEGKLPKASAKWILSDLFPLFDDDMAILKIPIFAFKQAKCVDILKKLAYKVIDINTLDEVDMETILANIGLANQKLKKDNWFKDKVKTYKLTGKNTQDALAKLLKDFI